MPATRPLGSGYFAELPIGDEFVGLNRAFLAAGSASVMATLWQVDDRASVSLMKQFLRAPERSQATSATPRARWRPRSARCVAHRSSDIRTTGLRTSWSDRSHARSRGRKEFVGENVMNAWKRIALTFLSLLVLGLAPIGAAIAQVKVTAATPASAYQGTLSLDVVVSGSGFDSDGQGAVLRVGHDQPGRHHRQEGRVSQARRELVTTIDVADTADLASFDIQVTLSSGRKGKGTTLFSVTSADGQD